MDNKKDIPQFIVRGNLLDNVVNFFSPTRGRARMAARYHQQIMADSVRRYSSANPKGKTSWYASGSSANTEVQIAGQRLRNISRELVRNNPYAQKAVKAIASNTVGSGIRPSVDYTDENVATKIKELWEGWADENICDFDGNHNFYGLQFLVMRSIVESGEVLIRKIKEPKGDVPIKLQVLESDFLDTGKDGVTLGAGSKNYIQMGIEFNEKGKKVAYWLYPQHPGENKVWTSLESVRVPVSELIHIFMVERPGQLRGIPFGQTVYDKMKDFDDYEDAQLIRQKIAACFSVFIHNQDGAPAGSPNPNGGPPLERVEPGIIEYLQPGQEVSFANPPATEGYDMYAKKMLQGIAAGYDTTYEQLTNDLSNVNFSSGRMGWIEFGRMVTQWQNQLIIGKFCKGVFDWFIEATSISKGTPKMVKASWTPPRREMLDPVKEMKGYIEAIRGGLRSRSSVIRELGFDPLLVLEELGKDAELMDKLGLMLTSDARYDSNRSNKESDEEKDDEEKDEKDD